MTATLSRIIQALEPSATMAMAGKAKEMKAGGQTVFDLSLGEPDFTTPDHICQAAVDAVRAGHTHYTPASGIPALRNAVVADCRRRLGLDFDPAQVVVSNGAKHALHNAMTAVLDPLDEVIIPAPYWVSYAELVKLTGAVPVIVPTRQEDDFKLTPEAFRAAVTDKTKMLLLNSPSNPTGGMYAREELDALAEIALERDLLVLSDEIYDQLIYGGRPFTSFPTLRPELLERTILVNGVSKTYAMTGWRIGWTITPAHIAKAIGGLQSQETSNPCSISQHAAVAALEGPQECVGQMLSAFAERRDYVRDRIDSIPGLSCAEIGGAFYAFINIKPHLSPGQGDTAWCLDLLAKQQVATVMGSAFGAEGYIRISFATSMENLKAAFDRIAEYVG